MKKGRSPYTDGKEPGPVVVLGLTLTINLGRQVNRG